MTESKNGGAITPATESARSGRSRVEEIIRQLEDAMALASSNRVEQWHARVFQRLKELQQVLRETREAINSKEGLYAEIIEDAPRLFNRVEKLKKEYDSLEQRVVDLLETLDPDRRAEGVVPDKVRDQVSQVIRMLRDIQYREAELIYEATEVDIGGGG